MHKLTNLNKEKNNILKLVSEHVKLMFNIDQAD